MVRNEEAGGSQPLGSNSVACRGTLGNGHAIRIIVHKDKPPGPFEFASRSARHAVSFGLACGAVLSIVAYVALALWGADSAARSGASAPAQTLEQATSGARTNAAAPTPADAAHD